MQQFIDTLFNTSHQAPSFTVLIVLIVIAIIVPPINRYLLSRRQPGSGQQNTKGKGKKK